MSKKLRDIHIKKSVKAKSDVNEYVIQMKRRRKFPWWILLLLLPFLMLIKCEKDITVTCYDADGMTPLPNTEVEIKHNARFLWDRGELFHTDVIIKTQTTDSSGQTVFKDLPCSVFSYVCYFFSSVWFDADCDGYVSSSVKCLFHTTSNVEILMAPLRDAAVIKLVDLENEMPLADGNVEYSYDFNGKTTSNSAKADANGVVTLSDLPSAATITQITGKCPEYADTIWTNIPVSDLVGKTTPMPLRPFKKTFTFTTIDAGCETLLPGCSLDIEGSISGSMLPTDSGDGTFTIEMRMGETLNISATKAGYEPNKNAVKNASVQDLEDDNARVIPLKIVTHSCDGYDITHEDADNGYHIRRYKITDKMGYATIDCDFDAAEDSIVVYDGTCNNDNEIIYEDYFNYTKSIPIQSQHGTITVVMKGNTIWKYNVRNGKN